MIRKANYANSWYPGTSDALKAALDEYFTENKFGPKEKPNCLNKEDREIIGGVSGHAGIPYSGPCEC